MKLTENIKALRKSKGITQIDMAEKLGVGQSNYTYLENRGDKLTVEQLEAIAGALGVSVIELMRNESHTDHNDERVKELEAEAKNEKEMREHFRRLYGEYNLILTNYFREKVYNEAVRLGMVSAEIEYFDIYKHYKNIDFRRIYKEVLSKDVLLSRLIKRGVFNEIGVDIKQLQADVENEEFELLKKKVEQLTIPNQPKS